MKRRSLITLFLLGYLLFTAAAAFAATPAQDAPVAFLPEKQFEFQSVPDGTQVTHEFKILNKGNATLEIKKVRTG